MGGRGSGKRKKDRYGQAYTAVVDRLRDMMQDPLRKMAIVDLLRVLWPIRHDGEGLYALIHVLSSGEWPFTDEKREAA